MPVRLRRSIFGTGKFAEEDKQGDPRHPLGDGMMVRVGRCDPGANDSKDAHLTFFTAMPTSAAYSPAMIRLEPRIHAREYGVAAKELTSQPT